MPSPARTTFSAHADICRARVPTPTRSHIELSSLHKIAALGLPVGVHPPSCDQIASAEIALLRHAVSRQRMHLVRLSEQARPIKHTKAFHQHNSPHARAYFVCFWPISFWLQVVGKAEVLTPADRAFLASRHLCQAGRSDVAVVQPVQVEQRG